ncbi:mitochondrial RNA pseudouridine synthase RPUSD4 [Nephila pilipes]|uniref:Pseudouridylate synthase RPUSD4, mitochondrial n=1 Tax=Nephila pilipes TaxID=299642 RepID=A0A8X6P8M1_NEPPI|nr:mitochondrial RNA pseudouridine synthase RPUSD4 [Nephila pilipes]
MFLHPKLSVCFPLNRLRKEVIVLSCRKYFICYSLSNRKGTEYRRYEDGTCMTSEFSVDQPREVSSNFYGVESDAGVIEVENNPSLNNSTKKRVFTKTEKDKIITARFGTIRYDAQNKPKVLKQIETSGAQHISDADEGRIFTSDRQSSFTKSVVENFKVSSKRRRNSRTVCVNENIKPESFSNSYIDQLYFHEKYVEKDCIENNPEHSSSLSVDKPNFVDECYFNNEITEESISKNMKTEFENIVVAEKQFTSSEKNLSAFIKENEKNSLIDEGYFSNEFSNNNLEIVDEESNKSIELCNTIGTEIILENQGIINTDTFLTNDIDYASNNVEMNANIEKNAVENTKSETCTSPEQLSIQNKNLVLEKYLKYDKLSSVTAKQEPRMKNNFLMTDFQKKIKNAPKMLKSELIESNSNEYLEGKAGHIEEENLKLHENKHIIQNLKIRKEKIGNEEPETAYDFVKKLRSAKKQLNPELVNGKFIPNVDKLDSLGFRILKNQVPNLMYYTRDEILDLLVKNVLYSDDDIVVLNKPYNLVIHDSKTVKDACLSQYLDDLASELDRQTNKPKLFTVHRLDKETTGCLLLARNETSAHMLKSLFVQRKIIKTYWIVTIKVPDPLKGIIDIPISEGSVQNKARMVLHPDLPKDIEYKNHSNRGKRAVTHYKVIAQSGNAALVEVKPETGLKHQIRVHFGFGLSCPILGDHKYSYLDKLVPQKLQSDLLQRLHVRQSKVRHIPMHIYARSILIPQYRDGRNLFVMAPMPLHMSKNLQKLKFKKN